MERIGNSKRKNGGKPAPKATKDRAYQLYLQLGSQWAEISRRLKSEGHDRCEPSTVRQWHRREDWQARALADGGNAGEVAKVEPKSRRPAPVADLAAHRERKSDLENVKDAISAVVQTIEDARALQEYRAIGSLATALCKLIELKLKISPASASELAQRAIELGLSPEQFLEELMDAWRVKTG